MFLKPSSADPFTEMQLYLKSISNFYNNNIIMKYQQNFGGKFYGLMVPEKQIAFKIFSGIISVKG